MSSCAFDYSRESEQGPMPQIQWVTDEPNSHEQWIGKYPSIERCISARRDHQGGTASWKNSPPSGEFFLPIDEPKSGSDHQRAGNGKKVWLCCALECEKSRMVKSCISQQT